MRRHAIGLGLASLAVHVAVFALLSATAADAPQPLHAEHGIAPWVQRSVGVPVAPWPTSGPPPGIRARLTAERAQLVDRSRAAQRAGKLQLGEFLLEANRLDALERGRVLDVATARLRFEARVRAIRDASPKRALSDVVEEVFDDISYIGRPGGLMSDVLLEGGGACEPLSHLVVAAVADAGQRDRVALRHYGGIGRAGVRHLAPIDTGGEQALDLMTGEAPAPGGTQFAADDLVEVYARAHAAPLRGGITGDAVRVDARYSMASGYPKNSDAHPSGMPLYATRAIGGGSAPASTPRSAHDDGDGTGIAGVRKKRGLECARSVGMSTLAPMQWTAQWPTSAGRASSIDVEPRLAPPPSKIARYAALMQTAEQDATDPTSSAAERLMSWACLTALYEQAAVDFSLLGEHELAQLASENEKKVRARGAEVLKTSWHEAAAPDRAVFAREVSQSFPGHTWLVLVLAGSEALVRASPEGSVDEESRGWGSIITLAGMAVNPATRARTLADIAVVPRKDQVDVMHEIFRVHGDMGYQASAFVLDDAAADAHGAQTEFARAYRVFRRLAWRLWGGGGQTFAKISPALRQELSDEGLGAEWEAPMLTYYLNYVIGLLHYREDGLTVLTQLDALIAERPELDIDPLRKRVRFLVAQQRVDPKAVAEAFRKQPDR